MVVEAKLVRRGVVAPGFISEFETHQSPQEESKMAKVMTPEEFTKKMQELIDKYGDDREAIHKEVDVFMESVLTDLGYGEGIELYHNSDLLIYYS